VIPAGSFTEFLEQARMRVDSALERWLPSPPDAPALIASAMRYSIFAGGKRLRPALALAAADDVARMRARTQSSDRSAAPGELDELALPAACALELLHTYSLIHDDLPAMDNDTLRRGRPTLHVVYGDGIAVLAGDGLQAEAFGLLAREPMTTDPEIVGRKLRVVGIIAAAVGAPGMVGGQAIDLEAAGQVLGRALQLDASSLREMHARKTGALIRASVASGAIMAGADDRTTECIDAFGEQLGIAFQIIDDVLDVEGDDTTLGKTAGKDAASGKPSYPALFGLAESRAMAAACVARANAALERAAMTRGRLAQIADWVITRRH
jgi:geranylgeranyl pyrophosphate synthase